MNDSQKYLYILFSATPYRMGRWIRSVTGEPYNHVALATEEDLSDLYAFARRFYRTPFYGGFVTEHPDRYRHNGVISDVKLYRLPLTDYQWKRLSKLLQQLRNNPEHYLYNHLSVLMAPMHKKVSVQDAFTCAEFAVCVLDYLGYKFDPQRFYSICEIAQELEPYLYYTGKFPEGNAGDPAFFQSHPVDHPLLTSARDFFALCWRFTATNIGLARYCRGNFASQ